MNLHMLEESEYRDTIHAVELWMTYNRNKIEKYTGSFRSIFPNNSRYLNTCILQVPHEVCLVLSVDGNCNVVKVEFSKCYNINGYYTVAWLHPLWP